MTPAPDPRRAGPHEAVRAWRPSPEAPVEFLEVTDTARRWTMYHERYGLTLTRRGPFAWRYRGAWRDCGPGEVALMQPGEAHAFTPSAEPHSCWSVFLAPDTLAAAAADLGLAHVPDLPALRTVQTHDPAVTGALRALREAVTGDGSRLAQETHVAALVRTLVERHGERRLAPRTPDRAAAIAAVRRAREYLHANAAVNVSLDALARAAYLSKYHLARTFTAVEGVPPHQYVTALRLARVKTALAKGMSVSRAALDAGFLSQAHLHRHFVAAFGVTPGRYARGVRPRA